MQCFDVAEQQRVLFASVEVFPRVSDSSLNFICSLLFQVLTGGRAFFVPWTVMAVLDVDHVVLDKDPVTGRFQLSSLISYEIIRFPIGTVELIFEEGHGFCVQAPG